MNNYLVYKELVRSADKWPHHSAIHDFEGTMSFKELLNAVDDLKEELMVLGVKPGMGIGVKARNSREFIIAVFALLGCGAAVMPVSHQLKKPEIDEILREARLHAMIDDNSGVIPIEYSRNLLKKVKHRLFFTFSEVPKEEVFAPHVESPAFIRFTSGTTGNSKGVVINNQAVIERTTAANKSLGLNEYSNVIWVLPMAYHFVVSIVLYIRVGAAITIVREFMARDIISMTNKFKGTMLYASPMQIKLLASDRGEENMTTLQKVISTSSGINPEVSMAFKKRFDKTVYQAFGIIEVGLPIINTEDDDQLLDSVGYPLPDFDVQVFDENYTILPRGEIGMLGIKGPGMFSAYLTPPVLLKDLMVDGYFFSADYAKIDNEGRVRIVGREKSMINVAGNKVFAEEVENVLEDLEIIKKARVSGVPHPLMGQIIQAEVVLDGVDDIDVESTLTYCRKRLSTFKIPQKLIVVDELEMTGSGKLKRL